MRKINYLCVLGLTALLLTGCGQENSKLSYIGAENAKTFALESAGITAAQVTSTNTDLHTKNGVDYYLVEFSAGGDTYQYDVDALTGKIIESRMDVAQANLQQNSLGKEPAPESDGTISEARAKEIALTQVPGAAVSDIREFSIDHEDSRLEYEGKIYYNHMEYEFEIDGYSGAIRDWDVESIYD